MSTSCLQVPLSKWLQLQGPQHRTAGRLWLETQWASIAGRVVVVLAPAIVTNRLDLDQPRLDLRSSSPQRSRRQTAREGVSAKTPRTHRHNASPRRTVPRPTSHPLPLRPHSSTAQPWPTVLRPMARQMGPVYLPHLLRHASAPPASSPLPRPFLRLSVKLGASQTLHHKPLLLSRHRSPHGQRAS